MDTFARDDWPDLANFVSRTFGKHCLSVLESFSGPDLLVVGSAVSGQSGIQPSLHPTDVWSTVFVVGCLRYRDGLADHRMDDRCGSQTTTGRRGGSDPLSDLGNDRHGAAVVDRMVESLTCVGSKKLAPSRA